MLEQLDISAKEAKTEQLQSQSMSKMNLDQESQKNFVKNDPTIFENSSSPRTSNFNAKK